METEFDDDPVQVYLRECGAIPPLTKDEEIELSQHLLADDEQSESARVRLIEANLAMVVSIAQVYRDSRMHLLELVQEGNEGLLLAARTFPDNSNKSFSAHAADCIHAAIAKAIAAER